MNIDNKINKILVKWSNDFDVMNDHSREVATKEIKQSILKAIMKKVRYDEYVMYGEVGYVTESVIKDLLK